MGTRKKGEVHAGEKDIGGGDAHCGGNTSTRGKVLEEEQSCTQKKGERKKTKPGSKKKLGLRSERSAPRTAACRKEKAAGLEKKQRPNQKKNCHLKRHLKGKVLVG